MTAFVQDSLCLCGFIIVNNISSHSLFWEIWDKNVQGRDFGYCGPGRWLSPSCSFLLATGAVSLLWCVIKKKRILPEIDDSRV